MASLPLDPRLLYGHVMILVKWSSWKIDHWCLEVTVTYFWSFEGQACRCSHQHEDFANEEIYYCRAVHAKMSSEFLRSQIASSRDVFRNVYAFSTLVPIKGADVTQNTPRHIFPARWCSESFSQTSIAFLLVSGPKFPIFYDFLMCEFEAFGDWYRPCGHFILSYHSGEKTDCGSPNCKNSRKHRHTTENCPCPSIATDNRRIVNLFHHICDNCKRKAFDELTTRRWIKNSCFLCLHSLFHTHFSLPTFPPTALTWQVRLFGPPCPWLVREYYYKYSLRARKIKYRE